MGIFDSGGLSSLTKGEVFNAVGKAGEGLASFGQASQEFYSAKASKAAAGNYRKAAAGLEVSLDLAEENTRLQQFQTLRQSLQVIGRQEAAVGAAGFEQGGSFLDLMVSSQQQAGLARAMIGLQGVSQAVNIRQEQDALEAQAAAADSAAKAKKSAGTMDTILGIAKVGIGIAGLF